MNGKVIYPSEYIKYLGIYLDETLSGKTHCDSLNIWLLNMGSRHK